MTQHSLPELLAPAGDMSCFIAGMAAGADATSDEVAAEPADAPAADATDAKA